jgi:hypothetical protein
MRIRLNPTGRVGRTTLIAYWFIRILWLLLFLGALVALVYSSQKHSSAPQPSPQPTGIIAP